MLRLVVVEEWTLSGIHKGGIRLHFDRSIVRMAGHWGQRGCVWARSVLSYRSL